VRASESESGHLPEALYDPLGFPQYATCAISDFQAFLALITTGNTKQAVRAEAFFSRNKN
jgi:hypothetical protein